MKELTEGTPKPLLQVAGRALLEYEFDSLPDEVDEVILVVGYLGGMIHDAFGPEYYGKRILYIEQEELNGTAGALWLAKDILKDRFLVLMADDIYARADVAKAASAKNWTMGVQQLDAIEEGGEVMVDKSGHITEIVEGEHSGKLGLISTNLFGLDTRIFDIKPVLKAPGSDEFGLPQTALAASDKLKIPLEAIPSVGWIKITAPKDLQKAEEILSKQ